MWFFYLKTLKIKSSTWLCHLIVFVWFRLFFRFHSNEFPVFRNYFTKMNFNASDDPTILIPGSCTVSQITCAHRISDTGITKNTVTVDWISLSIVFHMNAFHCATAEDRKILQYRNHLWMEKKTAAISYRTAKRETIDAENTTLKSFIEWINA